MATMRMRDGAGPEVSVPEWVNREPTAAEWVTWYLAQSREAQEWVAEYHLALDEALDSVRLALSEKGFL